MDFIFGGVFSGDYNDLDNLPTIPTNNDQLINGAGYITDYTVTELDVVTHQGALTLTQSQVTNLSTSLSTKANLSGATFTGGISVPDETYGVAWNGSLEVPTKNALYDKIETLGGVTTFTGLTDTPSSLSSQNYKMVRVNSAGSALEFTDDLRPNTDQDGGIGVNTSRYDKVIGRFGQFVGTSNSSGGISTSTTTRTAASNPTGIMAGNQVKGSTGSATHYMYTGAFKAVACIGNVYTAGSGNALLSNGGGGSSVFGSAFTYGSGNAEVKSTNFGNFTAVYAYATSNNHIWTNNAAGGFMA